MECLAIVFAFEKLKPFLEHKEFLLETDNQALSWLQKAGLTVNPKKVNFAAPQFSFLGHIVKANGKVSIDPERTRAIREFSPPRDANGIALSLIHI